MGEYYWNNLITMEKLILIGSVAANIALFIGWAWRGFVWIKKRNELEQEVASIKEELAIMTYALLSCLEKHLNKKAHEVR